MNIEQRKETLPEKIFLLFFSIVFIFAAGLLIVAIYSFIFFLLLCKTLYELFLFAIRTVFSRESQKETNKIKF